MTLMVLAALSAHATCTTLPPDSEVVERPQLLPVVAHPSTELSVVGYALDAVTPVGNGEVEVSLFASIDNAGEGSFSGGQAVLDPLHPSAVLVDDTVDLPAIGPLGSVVTTDAFVVRVPQAQLQVFRQVMQQNILPSWTVIGHEVPVLQPGVHILDEETDLAWLRTETDAYGQVVHWFDRRTALIDSLVAGDTVMDEAYQPVNLFCSDLPLVVAYVVDGPDDEVGVADTGQAVDLFDLYASFAFADDTAVETNPFRPHDTDPNRDEPGCEAAGLCAPPAPNHRFNDIDVAGVVSVGGHLSMRVAAVRFTGWMRNGAVQGGQLTVDAEGLATLQARALQTASLPPTEQTLVNFSVPVLAADVGFGLQVTVQGDFRAYVSADGEVVADAIVGVTQGIALQGTFWWDDGLPRFSSALALTHGTTSPPQLADVASGRLRVAAGLAPGLSAEISVTGIPLADAAASLDSRFQLEARVDPAADPWWTLDGGVEHSATFDVNALGMQVFSEVYPLEIGPPQPVLQAAPDPGTPGTRRSTRAVRWAQVVDLPSQFQDTGQQAAVLADGALALGGSNILDDALVVLEREGQVRYSVDMSHTPTAFADPGDGSLVAAGADGGVAWLARLDAGGSVLWSVRHDVGPGATVREVIVHGGGTAYTLVGSVLLGASAPYAVHLDPAGSVLWANAYPGPTGWAYGEAALARSDGSLVVVGQTHVAGADRQLALVLDAADGSVARAHSVTGTAAHAVAETAAGDLVLGGTWSNTVWDPGHAFLATMLRGDLSLRWQSTYAEDVAYEGRVVNRVEHIAGDTLWDTAHAVVASDRGATFAGVSGIGASAGAWVLQLDDTGNPIWLVTYDGPDDDGLFALDDTGDGLLAFGTTVSTGEAELWTMVLPWEGQTAMTDDPAIGWRYTQPHVDDYGGGGFGGLTYASSSRAFAQAVTPLAVTPAAGSVTATPSPLVWTVLQAVP